MADHNNLIGSSEYFLSVLDHVSQIAPLNRPVLILGERGTGKELIAKRIHYLSTRWNKNLISLNCAALNEGVIDSELFGHESGSFSGAKNKHMGRFERAEGGTLFLDELATSPIQVQEKLLRVIEYGEYERVGGHQTLHSNVRLICATNQDLNTMVENGQFRADLLDRLTFDIIHVPPLRYRKDDILLLAEHFARKMCSELGYEYFCGFSKQAEEKLKAYSWPGNVRELKNVIERVVYRHGQNKALIEHIHFNPFQPPWEKQTLSHHQTNHTNSDDNSSQDSPQNIAQQTEQIQPLAQITTTTENLTHHPSIIRNEENHQRLESYSFPMKLRAWQYKKEKEIVEIALTKAKFNQGQAAELLGLSYHQLRGLLRKHHLIGE